MAVLKVGDILDIFILRSKLHEGPLSIIFLAEDLLSRQQVVLKIPCSDVLNQPIILYHYQNEDRLSRILNHPGIIEYIHRQKSRQYLIMEYVKGKDLRSCIGKNRPLELNAALALMDQLCSVVAWLHERGIVHLDLKPENIICDSNSTIKVVDFGLASCRNLPDLLAMDLKNPLGTPWYIAPEQLLGERADPRCDIYTMGMLLYEMFTGRLPWPRTSKLRVARRRLGQDPAPPRYYNINIPPRIQSIILRAIARHADDRYGSVAELRHDLSQWRQHPVTEQGSICKLPPLWRRLLPKAGISLGSGKPPDPVKSIDKPQIIGALIDAPGSDNMLAEIKKQALIRSAEITLVHVIEEESDSHFRRYGITVEGEKLMARIEKAVQLFRRCSIDPSIRLVRGETVDILRQLCTDLDAELMVLAGSRKKQGILRSASVCHFLESNNPCRVVVAEESAFSPATGLAALQPEQLTAGQVLACDIFLVDLWYEHLHYHTDVIYRKLMYPDDNIVLSEKDCLFGRFLDSFAAETSWQEITSILTPIHKRFHQLADQMVEHCEHDPATIQNLYIHELLPLSCRLKNELARISLILRAHLDLPPPEVPFLTDNICPVTQKDLDCYGPLLRAFNLERDLCSLNLGKEESTPGRQSAENN
ncbi:MAG: protein kinase [Deltaproteobacteria bacterium]|nr:protein kinase [Deltaproteobacteria bacterium]